MGALHDDLLPICAEIAPLIEELHQASRRSDGEARWQRRQIEQRIDALKEEARTRFASARGWRRTRHPFHVDGLMRGLCFSPLYTSREAGREWRSIERALGRPWIDHVEYYKTRGRDGLCAAIVSHAYLGRENDNPNAKAAVAYAESVGLTCEVFPPAYSWYYPGSTTLLIFTSMAIAAITRAREEAVP